MNAPAIGARAVRCACRARPGRPCTPSGDHLARYLAADASGMITRDQLTAVITSLVVVAPHIVIAPTAGHSAGPARPPARRAGRPLRAERSQLT